MTHDERYEEMVRRLQKSMADHGGMLSETFAAAWDGYFAALLEWGLILPDQHSRLLHLIPTKVADNPTLEIFLGGPWKGQDSEKTEGEPG